MNERERERIRHLNPKYQKYVSPQTFRYYGSYGGPNYSAGKYLANTKDILEGKTIDDLDEKFKVHDIYYNLGKSREGDDALINETSGLYGIKEYIELGLNPLGFVKDIYNESDKGKSALASNIGFRAKRFLSKSGISINNPKRNPELTPQMENKFKEYIRKHTLKEAYASIGRSVY